MGGVDSYHIWPQILNDLIHGPGGVIRIHIAKLAAINHEHLIGRLLGFDYLLDKLSFQFPGILVETRCRKKK